MDLLQLMRQSREMLIPHWLLSVGICVLYVLIIGIPAEQNSYGEMLSFLLAGPLQLGLCIYFLNIIHQEKPSIFNLLQGFKPLLQVLLAYLVVTVMVVLGLLFFIVPGIILSLGLSMTFYIIAERPEIPFGDAIQESWNLTNGYKTELLVLHLRFLPWYVLGLLFFIVGIFVIVPWHYTSIALYYNYLKKQPRII